MRQRIDILDTTIVYIEILRFLPKRKFISAQDINQHLRSSGFERDIRSVQRILNKLSEHFDIELIDRFQDLKLTFFCEVPCYPSPSPNPR